MYKYIVIDRTKAKMSPIGMIFCSESIIGTVQAKSKIKAAALVAEVTNLSEFSVIAFSSTSLNESDRSIALTKPNLVTQKLPNNDRNAGAKRKGTVKYVQLRLSEKALEHINRQPNQAGYIAKLIEDAILKTST